MLSVDPVAVRLDTGQQVLRAVEVLEIGHYNFQMSGDLQILVSAPAARAALAAAALALLGACGQKGPLVLPTGEAAAGRASLHEYARALVRGGQPRPCRIRRPALRHGLTDPPAMSNAPLPAPRSCTPAPRNCS